MSRNLPGQGHSEKRISAQQGSLDHFYNNALSIDQSLVDGQLHNARLRGLKRPGEIGSGQLLTSGGHASLRSDNE